MTLEVNQKSELAEETVSTDRIYRLLVIIPAYNEEKALGGVIARIKDSCPQARILVVDDGSRDRTRQVAESQGARVTSLPLNLGIGVAMRVGYRIAYQQGYDFAVQIDADGQHDPKFIEDLIGPLLAKECDMVIGSRFLKKEGYISSKTRRIGIRFFSFLLYLLTGQWISDPTSGNRSFNRRALEVFSVDYPSDYPEPEAILILHKKGLRVKEIPVLMDRRQAGESSISFHKAIYYMVKVTLAILLRFIKGS